VLAKYALIAVFSGADRGGKNASPAAQDLRSPESVSLLIGALLLAISRCRLSVTHHPTGASYKKGTGLTPRFASSQGQHGGGITSHQLFLFETRRRGNLHHRKCFRLSARAIRWEEKED
jgi:hypothetical protein